MNASGPPDLTRGWKARLREAIGADIVAVKYCPTSEGVQFVLMHSPGRRADALARFLEALREAEDSPDFEVRIVEAGSAQSEQTDVREYVSV